MLFDSLHNSQRTCLRDLSRASSVAPQVPISVKPRTSLSPGAALFKSSIVYCFVASAPDQKIVSGKFTQIMMSPRSRPGVPEGKVGHRWRRECFHHVNPGFGDHLFVACQIERDVAVQSQDLALGLKVGHPFLVEG